jgi:hypothetical protein
MAVFSGSVGPVAAWSILLSFRSADGQVALGPGRKPLRRDARVSPRYFFVPVRPDIASGQFLARSLSYVSLLKITWYANEFSVIASHYVNLVICSLLGRPVVVTATV